MTKNREAVIWPYSEPKDKKQVVWLDEEGGGRRSGGIGVVWPEEDEGSDVGGETMLGAIGGVLDDVFGGGVVWPEKEEKKDRGVGKKVTGVVGKGVRGVAKLAGKAAGGAAGAAVALLVSSREAKKAKNEAVAQSAQSVGSVSTQIVPRQPDKVIVVEIPQEGTGIVKGNRRNRVAGAFEAPRSGEIVSVFGRDITDLDVNNG